MLLLKINLQHRMVRFCRGRSLRFGFCSSQTFCFLFPLMLFCFSHHEAASVSRCTQPKSLTALSSGGCVAMVNKTEQQKISKATAAIFVQPRSLFSYFIRTAVIPKHLIQNLWKNKAESLRFTLTCKKERVKKIDPTLFLPFHWKSWTFIL